MERIYKPRLTAQKGETTKAHAQKAKTFRAGLFVVSANIRNDIKLVQYLCLNIADAGPEPSAL
jgi:hypothetical protein